MKCLEAKVRAVNRAHKLANELYEKMAPIFTGLVGTTIRKKDHTLLKKIEEMLPKDWEEQPKVFQSFTVTYRCDAYSLCWTAWVNELYQVGSREIRTGSESYELTVYLGDVQNGVLTRIIPNRNRRCDYTEQEIRAKQAALKEAARILSEAQEALFPFKEND